MKEIKNTEKLRPITKLLIKVMEPRIINIDGNVMALPGVNIARRFPDKSIKLASLSNLQNTAKLEVIFIDPSGETTFALPQDILDKLAEYLCKTGAEKERFDCSRFIYFLFDVEYRFSIEEGGGVRITEDWDIIKEQNINNLSIGDAVIFLENEGDSINNIKHFGLYLGNKHFLSQSGTGGELAVGDIFTMHQIYNTDTLYKITPKK